MPVKIHIRVKVSWIEILVYSVFRIIIHLKALERLREKKMVNNKNLCSYEPLPKMVWAGLGRFVQIAFMEVESS
jgi:hypothetical protein